MAEFVKVMKEKERMCKTFIACGAGCPLSEVIDEGVPCRNWICNHPEEAERIVIQWATEHPEPDPVFEKLKSILESSKDDDLLCKIVKWYVEDYAKEKSDG